MLRPASTVNGELGAFWLKTAVSVFVVPEMPGGVFNPATSEAFTVAPEVVYSPTVPVPSEPPSSTTKICPRAVAGLAQSAAARRRSVKRARQSGPGLSVVLSFMVIILVATWGNSARYNKNGRPLARTATTGECTGR